MTDWWRTDPSGVRRSQPAVVALAHSLAELGRRLGAALDAEGECWGRDRIGAAFAESYLPTAERACEAFPGLGDEVRAVGDALLMVADAVDEVENRTRGRFS